MTRLKFLLTLFSLIAAFSFLEAAFEDFPVKWAWIGADCTNEVSCGSTTSPVGWISLDSDNLMVSGCARYKVTVNYNSGEIKGAGFIGVGEDTDNESINCSENSVGWLNFDSNGTPPCGSNGYPNDYCFPAKLVRVADGWEIQGWAPIISKNASRNATTVTWVRFKGSNYVVKIREDKKISSEPTEHFAWSGFNREGGLGWIKFFATTTSPPPFSCSLTAQPFMGQAPLRVNFNLNITNCRRIGPITWDGPCTLRNNTCSYTYQNEGTYGPYTANVTCLDSGTTTQCSSPPIQVFPPPLGFNAAVTQLDVRSFICKNENVDQSYWYEYRSRYPSYQFPPNNSTEVVSNYNRVIRCPESQRNRPVEFSAKAECVYGDCPPAKLNIYVEPLNPLAEPRETFEIETPLNAIYPKVKKGEKIFDNAFTYSVKACLFDEENIILVDDDPTDNCLETTFSVYNYYCRLGFCAQAERDWAAPPLFEKILKFFKDTDAPCDYWLNLKCRARFRF